MVRYFTFDGIQSNTMNIRAISSDRIVLPTRKNTTIILPNSNDVILIPDNTFNPFNITVECLVEIFDDSSIFQVSRNISNWLNTDGFRQLEFSDDPGYTYNAIVDNEIVLETLRDKRRATFTIEFLCTIRN